MTGNLTKSKVTQKVKTSPFFALKWPKLTWEWNRDVSRPILKAFEALKWSKYGSKVNQKVEQTDKNGRFLVFETKI